MTRRRKIDTRSLGLDLGAGFARFITGRENLHYGYWDDGVEVCAGNLREAQEAYSEKIKSCFPPGRLRVLDVGGGCGEFARDLSEDGHDVEIVVPSDALADRCRINAGRAAVHVLRFEDFPAEPRFDLCLFAESLQYINPDIALTNASACLAPGGEIVIADCFRTEEFYEELTLDGIAGGGHALADFRAVLSAGGFETLREEDITEAVAPSIDLEQDFYSMIGSWLRRLDGEFSAVHPFKRRLAGLAIRLSINARRRRRLEGRLFGESRSAAVFCRCNRYLVFRIKPAAAGPARL